MSIKETMFQGHGSVKQECILSPLLRGMALNFITRERANKHIKTRHSKSQQKYNERSRFC